MKYSIRKVVPSDVFYAEELSEAYKVSAQQRGTGIAIRTPEYISKRIENGNAIIALDGTKLAGFCYIEVFSSDRYVSNSGLIVLPDFRGNRLSYEIKQAAFLLARNKFPYAKVFGITTSPIVMKMNANLGYIPVALSDLTTDDEFWNSCSTCKNYDILQSKDRKMCLCTAMMAPSKNESKAMQSLINKKSDKNEKAQ